MRARVSLAAALLAFLAPAAVAQAPAPKVDCARAVSTPELNWCEEQELDKADKALNAAYRATLARIDRQTEDDPKLRKEWRQAVQEAQRRWIAFRDADCNSAVAYEWHGGTGATVAVLGCLRAMTIARTNELKERDAR